MKRDLRHEWWEQNADQSMCLNRRNKTSSGDLILKKMLRLKMVLLLSLVSMLAHGQDQVVTGKVTSAEDGSALPGVNVVVKGTLTGAVTDADGKYSVTLPAAGGTLVFSSIGFQTLEINVRQQTKVDVALNADVTELNEIVVTAFGEMKRTSFTGSSAQVSSSQLADRPLSNVFQALSGAASGVTTTIGTGQPGSAPEVRIRGFGSISSSNAPLYIVDGVPFITTSASGVPFTDNLANINPDDIESISILKDAASTSLYGARAANGVVIITTKKGKQGTSSINVKYTKGVSSRAIPEYDRVGPADYYPLMWETNRNSLAYRATNPVPLATANQNASDNLQSLLGYNVYDVPFNQLVDVNGVFNPNANLIYSKKDLNWEDPLVRKGNRDEFSFNMSGANEKTDYFFSASYLDDTGFLIRSSFERFTSRLNINTKVNSWLKTGANITATLSKSNQSDGANPNTNTGNTSFVNQFFFSRNIGPIFPVYAFDPANPGQFLLDDNGDRIFDYGNMNALGLPNRPQFGGRHTVAETTLNQDVQKRNAFGGRAYAEITFLKDFKFTFNAGAEITNRNNYNYQNPLIGDGAPAGRATHRFDQLMGLNYNQLLTYNRTFGDHTIGALVGHESFINRSNYLTGSRSAQILDGTVEFANFTTTTNLYSELNERSVEGYFSRINYDYKEKYFASASVRRDGSSRFFKDVRWGTFFSVSGAWRLDQEDFIKQIDQISVLKLRGSYGQTGNEEILDALGDVVNYAWQPLFQLGWNNASEAGILQESLGNRNLTWESSDAIDVALEFGLFKNRITGSVEYFNRASSNLIFSVPLPLSSGVLTETRNIGTMVNSGIEVELGAEVLKINDFSWNINLNATKLKNEITKMPVESPEIINGTKKLKEGRSIYDFWLREYMGVSPQTGEAYYRASSFVPANSIILESGDTVTTSISNARFHYNGSSIPKLTGGINNTFRYKNLSLSTLIVYQIGGKTYDDAYAGLMGSGGYGSAKHVDILKRWRNPGDITDVPRLDAGRTADFDAASDRWLTDASYLNVRAITLAYTLPKSLLQKTGLSNVQVFLSGENLVTLSKRKGMNVQQNFGGVTGNVFSPAKSLVGGLSVSF